MSLLVLWYVHDRWLGANYTVTYWAIGLVKVQSFCTGKFNREPGANPQSPESRLNVFYQGREVEQVCSTLISLPTGIRV